MRHFVLLVVFLCSTSASAISCASLLRQPKSPQEWVQLRGELQDRMVAGTQGAERLLVDKSFLLSVGKHLGSGVHGRVDAVVTKKGPMALKTIYFWPGIYPKQTVDKNGIPDDYLPPLLLQEMLGELGVTPRIYGIVPKKELLSFLEGKPDFEAQRPFAQYGILMEQIGDGENIKNFSHPANVILNAKEVEARLKECFQVLAYLRITAHDIDMMIAPSGRIYLHDLEFYTFHADNNRVFGRESTFALDGLAAPAPKLDPAFPSEFLFFQPQQFTGYLERILEIVPH